jgi:hypothetical protein
MSEHSIRNQEKKAIPAQLESALIISVKEARKIMGVDARTFSDDELAMEIWLLMEIAPDLLKSAHISGIKQL